MPKILLKQNSYSKQLKIWNQKNKASMMENWTMTNEFYSCEWKVNDVDWISYIMDEN
jgi:hypothetical protein